MEDLNIILTYEEQDQSNPTVINEGVKIKSDDFDTEFHHVSILEDFCHDCVANTNWNFDLQESNMKIGYKIALSDFPHYFERDFVGETYELAINDGMCEISNYFMLSGYVKLSSEELIKFIKNYVYVLNARKEVHFNIQIESDDHTQREDKDDFNEEGLRIEY